MMEHGHEHEHKHQHEGNVGPSMHEAASGGHPWKEGHYLGEGGFPAMEIIGDQGILKGGSEMKIVFISGDFGEADPEVAEVCGPGSRYSVQMKVEIADKARITPMVLTNEGRVFYFKSLIKIFPIGSLRWVTEEQAREAANDGDPIEAPPSKYKLEPERQGKLLWITGASGLGKSTTGQLLSRNHGFVFYEGDCFWSLRNPYIPPNVPEASLATLKQRKLVGEGAKERQEMVKKVNKDFMNMFGGNEYDEELVEEAYRMMCANIRSERARMGGDWAVCCLLLTKRIRDVVREELGEELHVICLDMELEDQMARVRLRHAGDQDSQDMMKMVIDRFERAGEDEPNCSQVMVGPDMKPEEVARMVLEKVNAK